MSHEESPDYGNVEEEKRNHWNCGIKHNQKNCIDINVPGIWCKASAPQRGKGWHSETGCKNERAIANSSKDKNYQGVNTNSLFAAENIGLVRKNNCIEPIKCHPSYGIRTETSQKMVRINKVFAKPFCDRIQIHCIRYCCKKLSCYNNVVTYCKYWHLNTDGRFSVLLHVHYKKRKCVGHQTWWVYGICEQQTKYRSYFVFNRFGIFWNFWTTFACLILIFCKIPRWLSCCVVPVGWNRQRNIDAGHIGCHCPFRFIGWCSFPWTEISMLWSAKVHKPPAQIFEVPRGVENVCKVWCQKITRPSKYEGNFISNRLCLVSSE